MLKVKMLNKTPIIVLLAMFISFSSYAVHDYANALYLTTYYYGAQRCGNTGSWVHAACHVKDGQAQGIDLTGGWHDCGDHVTFGQTAPYAAGALIEGYLMYPSAYEDRYSSANSAPPANGIPDVLDEAKIMTDLLIKSTTGGRFYYQKGNGDYDHKHMSEPAYYSTTYNVTDGGEKDGPRPMSFVTSGGSNVCGDAAAVLALMAIAYQPYDAAYATTCFTKAKEVFAIGDTSPGTVGGGSYYGAANYEDDMSWGAIAIYRASQARGAAEATYLTKATTYANSGNFQQAGYWPLCYDHTEELANYGLYVVTSNAMYRTRLADEITYYKATMDTCGSGQYAWITEWGSLRYAGNMAFAAMLYYKISNDATAYDFAKKNVDFALGTHGDIAGAPGAPAGRSFVVGYTNPDNVAAGSVAHPHHRAAFGKTSSADTDWVTEKNNPGSIAYKYVLKGALVGGPRAACSNYNDNIDDYVANEVGVDYNAGLVGAIAAVKYVLNPSTPTRTVTPNLSMTRTFTMTVTRTLTITPTFTQSPVPPPTNKLNLEVMSQGSSANCTTQTFGFQYKITNWENTVVNTTNMAIKVWVDTADTISGSIYNARKYDSVGLDLGTVTAAIAQGATAGCAGATKSVLITITATDIPANGGYIVIQGALERGGYQTPFDAGCNDYTKMLSTWTTYQNNTTQNLFQGTNLVCEYISNTTQDTSTGLNPCTLANGCGAPTTPTRTPVITNSFTRTATYTFTRTVTLVPPTATFTSTATRTNTPLIPSLTFTSTVTRTNTPLIPSFTFTSTVTRTNTPLIPSLTFTSTVTRTNTPLIPSFTFTSTVTRTSTPTITMTSTLVSSPTLTWTRTFTPTVTRTSSLTSTLTPGPSLTFTATATSTRTITNTSTPLPSSTFTATRTSTPTFTNTVTQTSSRTFTPTVTPTFTRTFTRTPSFTRTSTPTSTITPTFTISNTHTVSPTETPYAGTPTSTFTITETFTVTLTFTSTITETFTMTDTDTVTQTTTPTYTVTQTFTLTDTETFTPSRTQTFTVTLTETLIPTETFTQTPSDTPTGVPTDTFTETYTETFTETYTQTHTYTETPVNPTDTFTQTPTVPTNTFTATETFTVTDTVPASTYTPTNTNTFTNTSTWTNTSTPTATHTFTTVPTVSNPSLSAGINGPAEATAGGLLVVIMTVNNNGNAVINNVAPSVLSITGTTAALTLAGPAPASVPSLAIGASTSFTWVYNVLSSGVVVMQGTASGNAGAVNSPPAMSAGINLLAAPTPVETNTPAIMTPTPGSIIEVVTATPVVIYPNPNPTPGTTPGRFIDYTVNRPISKTVFKIYTSMGRLIRKAEDNTPKTQGKCLINLSGENFTGLAKGIYYYIIIVTDEGTGKDAKSPIGKLIVQ